MGPSQELESLRLADLASRFTGSLVRRSQAGQPKTAGVASAARRAAARGAWHAPLVALHCDMFGNVGIE